MRLTSPSRRFLSSNVSFLSGMAAAIAEVVSIEPWEDYLCLRLFDEERIVFVLTASGRGV